MSIVEYKNIGSVGFAKLIFVRRATKRYCAVDAVNCRSKIKDTDCLKEIDEALKNHCGGCAWPPLFSKSFWSSWLHITRRVFYVETELACN